MEKKTLLTVDLKVSEFDEVKSLLKEKQKEIEHLERQLKRSEKERWKTASNLFKCRKHLREIKEVVNVKGDCKNETSGRIKREV